ncbi:hypothetical protein ACFUN8_18570 [Streptomyces sp. NPDC057307]|uniref:hypothetical protein n=1 Tax=Streptomyces sp. NPDC057307 TaxID=3346096 RepID=UPI003642AC0C
MSSEYKVIAVTDYPNSSEPKWAVDMEKPDGNLHRHVLPKATLEWRAAEYGIDDVEELMDIVLHEPFQIPATEEELSWDAAAQEADTKLHRLPSLIEAESTTEAAESLRVRIARTKAEKVHVVSTPKKGQPDPLDKIRNEHGIDPERKREKRELVDTMRWMTRHGGLPITTTPSGKEGVRL